MLRRLVRSYYRLRYLPRLILEMLNGISNAVAGLRASESALITAHEERMAGLLRYEAELKDQLMTAHEERLTRTHEEFVAFCDDAIRAMMAVSTNVAAIDARLARIQHGLQRLDHETVDIQGRLAALHDWLRQPGRDETSPTAGPSESVGQRAMQTDHIDNRLAPALSATAHMPAAAPTPSALASPNGPADTAGSGGRSSRA